MQNSPSSGEELHDTSAVLTNPTGRSSLYKGAVLAEEADFNEKLQKHEASYVGLSNRRLEEKNREIELLSIHLDNKDKIIEALHTEIQSLKQQIFHYEEQISELRDWKAQTKPAKLAAVLQHQADAQAKVALSLAELQAQSTKEQTLTSKITQLEQAHLQKDQEIRKRIEQLTQREQQISVLRKQLQNFKFEMEIMDLQSKEAQSAACSREGELALAFKDKSAELIRSNQAEIEKLLSELSRAHDVNSELQRNLQELECNIQTEHRQNSALAEQLRTEIEARRALSQELGNIHASYASSSRSAEVEILKRTEADLRRRLAEQMEINEALDEDALILQRTRVEKAAKDKECAELRAQLHNMNQHKISDTPRLNSNNSSAHHTNAESQNIDAAVRLITSQMQYFGDYARLNSNGLYRFGETEVTLTLINSQVFAHLPTGLMSFHDFISRVLQRKTPDRFPFPFKTQESKPVKPTFIDPFSHTDSKAPQGFRSLQNF